MVRDHNMKPFYDHSFYKLTHKAHNRFYIQYRYYNCIRLTNDVTVMSSHFTLTVIRDVLIVPRALSAQNIVLVSLSQSTAPADIMSETGRTISGKSVGGSCWRGIVCKFSMRENSRNLLASDKRE